MDIDPCIPQTPSGCTPGSSAAVNSAAGVVIRQNARDIVASTMDAVYAALRYDELTNGELIGFMNALKVRGAARIQKTLKL